MTHRISLRVALMPLMMLCSLSVFAQRIALKTNTIDWLLQSPNLSFETRLSPRITLDFGAAGNFLKWSPYGSNYQLRNFRINPEVRYWFNRPMAKHFAGVAITFGTYDLRLNKHCYKGDIAAFGFTYGYALVLSRHWNVEFSAGVGLGKVWGYDYRPWEAVPEERNLDKWIPVPIRTRVSFSYIFD